MICSSSTACRGGRPRRRTNYLGSEWTNRLFQGALEFIVWLEPSWLSSARAPPEVPSSSIERKTWALRDQAHRAGVKNHACCVKTSGDWSGRTSSSEASLFELASSHRVAGILLDEPRVSVDRGANEFA